MLSRRTIQDPTSVNRKRNVSTSSVPHLQIALNPVLEEVSENENYDEETDDESLGTRAVILTFSI